MNFHYRIFCFLLLLHLVTSSREINAQETCTCRRSGNSTCLDISTSSSPSFTPLVCVARYIACDGLWVCDPAGTTICNTQNVTSYRITGPPLPYGELINGGFETPVIPAASYRIFDINLSPGWQTTATDNMIEYWSSGFQGQPSYQGNQFAELNANQEASLYQDVNIIPAGLPLNFSFAHAARGTLGRFDVMKVTITDLGYDQTYGTADDTVLFQQLYFAPINNTVNENVWTVHTSASEPEFLSLGNSTRFQYESISNGGNRTSYGNFLDDVSYGLEVPIGFDVYECAIQGVINAVPQ